jgi:hypothetical protein
MKPGNGFLGWALLVAGFGWAVWLDPWSLSESNPQALVGSARMAARQAHAVVVGMAFLQLMTFQVLRAPFFSSAIQRLVSWLTAVGAVAYVLGYMAAIEAPGSLWLVPCGALCNAIGFGILGFSCWTVHHQTNEATSRVLRVLKVILPVVVFGMLLDGAMGLSAWKPSLFWPEYLGAEDGVRLRMLRLARAAAIALSVLTLLFGDLIKAADEHRNASRQRVGGHNVPARRGQTLLLVGTALMPIILTAAALTIVQLKYLLPLAAFSIFIGTIIGMLIAKRNAHPLEFWGWLIIALSMCAGLFMGLYAFEGPMRPPEFLGGYNDFARRLSRLGHSYCVVLGLLAIFVARELPRPANEQLKKVSGGWMSWIGTRLLVAGSVATLVVILLVAAGVLPTSLLGVGPAMVAIAALLCTTLLKHPVVKHVVKVTISKE